MSSTSPQKLRSSRSNPNLVQPLTYPEHLIQESRKSVHSGTTFRTTAETVLPTHTSEDSSLSAAETSVGPSKQTTVSVEENTMPRVATNPHMQDHETTKVDDLWDAIQKMAGASKKEPHHPTPPVPYVSAYAST